MRVIPFAKVLYAHIDSHLHCTLFGLPSSRAILMWDGVSAKWPGPRHMCWPVLSWLRSPLLSCDVDVDVLAGGTATFTLLRSCWNVWALLLGASVHSTNPRGFASKFLTSVFALFSVVFLASYTANLAAFMIVQDHYFNFSGFEDPRVRPSGRPDPIRTHFLPLLRLYPALYAIIIPHEALVHCSNTYTIHEYSTANIFTFTLSSRPSGERYGAYMNSQVVCMWFTSGAGAIARARR